MREGVPRCSPELAVRAARGAKPCLSCCGFPGRNSTAELCAGMHGALQPAGCRNLCACGDLEPLPREKDRCEGC